MTSVQKVLITIVTKGSRAIFVIATAVLAIAGSRISGHASEIGSWMVATGAASIMFCADIGREVEEAARQLSTASKSDRSLARIDMFSTRAPRFTLLVMSAGFIVALSGGIMQVVLTN
jgi:hypothetical protein